MIYTILVILLIVALIAALPRWNYSRSWGYFPTGGLTVALIVVLIIMFGGGA